MLYVILLSVLFIGVSECASNSTNCGTYGPGMGYLLKCGKCYCSSNNTNICKRFTSLRCDPLTLWSKDFPNLCGKSNLAASVKKTKLSLDGCNYIRCKNKAGSPSSSSIMSCSMSNNTCKSHKPGYTYQDACKSTCVCTASGMPFCEDCKTHLPYYLFTNRAVRQCITGKTAGQHNGNGFFDQETCQMCICDTRGQAFCRQPNNYTASPDNLKSKCVPTPGANVTNVCRKSNMGKVYYDGCNVCKCGVTGKLPVWHPAWRPVECYTKARCFSNRTCRRKHPGYIYTSKARKARRSRPAIPSKRCICTISGRPFCKPL